MRPRRPVTRLARPAGLVWLGVTVVVSTALALSTMTYSSLDDSDQAYQRPGFLDPQGAPFPAKPVTSTVPARGHRALRVFVRPVDGATIIQTIAGDAVLRQQADLVIVSSGPGASGIPHLPVISDPGALADAYRMRRPKGNGHR